MDHLPIFFDVRGKTVVITGGGTVAARKSDMALRAGAHVRVFADELSDEFRDIAGHERFTHAHGFPSAEDVAGAALVYGGEEDYERDAALFRLARAARTPCNVADTQDLCDFITPAILDRSPLVAAVSSSGASPILARAIKAQLETIVPPNYGDLAEWAKGFREEVSERLPDGADRRRFWEIVMDGPVADSFLRGALGEAEAELRRTLDAEAQGAARGPRGEVYLVGAGPGDPDLLTFRALRLMQKAEVVLYDRLIGPQILNLVRRDAERIFVGKETSNHVVPQEEISRMLVRLAREGRRVLRLKGGDPFMFGRGGEEIEELAREGVPFQIVPGVTAATACAAYAGIPLTHRDHAQSCLFVTGHMKDGGIDLDWEALARPRQTIAIYMGLATLPALAAEMVSRGSRPDTPAAVVDNGSRPSQRVVVGTLADIAEKAEAAALKGPAIVLVGSVVSLHGALAWFGSRAPTPDARTG
ncbi:MAG: siroheme synthase CysG [Hyphomicrobiales bacterium]|nr:siroheme synthase CysG [Hyphomicrobiales bacterium]